MSQVGFEYVLCPVDRNVQRVPAGSWGFSCDICGATIFRNKDNWKNVDKSVWLQSQRKRQLGLSFDDRLIKRRLDEMGVAR